jgi:hypothetical protein
LLSQEHALSCADIGRVLNLPHSTVMHNLSRAVDKIVLELHNRSLIDTTVRKGSKVAEMLYCECFSAEDLENAQTRFGFYYDREPPWFYQGPNLLIVTDDS